MTEEQSREWHIDRSVSLGIIAVIIIQTAGIIWWAAGLSSTVAELRITDQKHEASLTALASGRESNASRITALETRSVSTDAKLDRIENKLDRLIEEKRP